MKWITIPVLLLATLSGCLGPGDASDDETPRGTGEPGPGSQSPGGTGLDGNETPTVPPVPTDLLWDGQVLEAIDCDEAFYNAYADREAVEVRVPSHLSVPGNGPVALIILLLDCRSMTIGNESLQEEAWMYLTYINVDDGEPATQGRIRYLLEFGSDWGEVWLPLQERGAAAVGGTFQHADVSGTDGLTITADGLTYTFRDTGTGPTQVPRGPGESILLAGPQAEVPLDFRIHYTEIDNLPVTGMLETNGGILNDLLGPASPLVATEGHGGATLRALVESA